MLNRRTLVCCAAGAAMVFSALAFGHVDDPKAKSRLPRYEGPGWRAGDGDARGARVEYAASNIQLMSWISLPEFGNHDSGNDCWGYVSPTGREYAIMGLYRGTSFVDITDPANPAILNTFTGPTSLWRDIKVYGHHAYAVSEGGGGIQVFDMNNIDSGVVTLVNTITTGGTTATHNVAIDTDSGYLYRCGGSGEGLRIYSLANPAAPAYVSSWPDRYVHDAQIVTMNVGGTLKQIAVCCSGLNGGSVETGVDILDVTNKTSIQLIKRYFYSGNARYSHQAWFSPDKKYLYLDDELDEGASVATTTMYVLDMQDLANPSTVGVISNGNTAINHNLYTKDQYVYCANYRSGLRVFDATDPINPVEVAYFDTFPNDDIDEFNGLWSNYPYYPSGTVIGSDMERGLFVWKMTLNQLAINVQQGGASGLIDPAGETISVTINEQDGTLDPSSPMLHYDAGSGYQSVSMVSRGGSIYEATLPAVPCGTIVHYYISADTTSGLNIFSPSDAPVTTYSALAAYDVVTAVDDNFQSDLGWTPTALGATSGQWQRGVPVNDGSWAYDPAADSDGSGMCWLTQNENGNTDVDGGSVQLMSPAIDLSAGNVVVSYDYYLRLTVADGVDMLKTEISSNGTAGPWTEVVRHTTDGGLAWRTHTFNEATLATLGVTLTNDMRLRFTANDTGTASIVEAGLDAFRIDIIDCEPPDEPVLGDLNGDDIVNTTDLFALLAAWGNCGNPCPPSCPADFTGDCVVDVNDLFLQLANWTP